jgi:hypothetical protein
VTIVERERNCGLSKSIISGTAQVSEEFGRVIAIEDDVVTAPDFLNYMNRALDRYAGEPRMFSVSGFNFPIAVPPSYSCDAFCTYRFLCWGWGTWNDRWRKVDWSVEDYPEFVADAKQQKRFNRGGDDLSWLLARHMSGKVDSWDTVWAYTHSKHDAVALLPVVSKVYNTGLDGSGFHCRRASFRQTILSSDSQSCFRFPDSVIPDPYFAAEIRRLHRQSLAKKVGRYIYERLDLR